MSLLNLGTTVAPENIRNESPRVISVSGGKGGVGKTFFSVNFATELRSRGYRVLIFDGDVNLSNVNLLLHIDENNRFRDFLDKKVGIDELVRKGVGGVDVIYAGDDLNDNFSFSDDELDYFAEELSKIEKNYDFIIIDTQAGMSDMNRRLIEDSEAAVMIANQEITSLVDLYKTIKLLASRKPGLPFQIVVNKSPNPERAVKIFQGVRDTLLANNVQASVQFLGFILDDPQRALASIQKRTPVRLLGDSGSLGGCFRLVADTYLKSNRPKPSPKPLFLSLFSRGGK